MIRPTSLFAGVLCLAFISGAVHAASVTVTPSSSTINIGDLLDLTIGGVSFTTPVDAGGFNISWDPAVLELGPSGYTRAAGFIPPSGNGTASAGIVSDVFFFADPAKSGAFNFGVLQLRAIGAGVSSIQMTESGINPFAGAGGALAVGFDTASVTVNGPGSGPGGDGVPEPGTSLMIAGGLAMTWLARRTRKALGSTAS